MSSNHYASLEIVDLHAISMDYIHHSFGAVFPPTICCAVKSKCCAMIKKIIYY